MKVQDSPCRDATLTALLSTTLILYQLNLSFTSLPKDTAIIPVSNLLTTYESTGQLVHVLMPPGVVKVQDVCDYPELIPSIVLYGYATRRGVTFIYLAF